MKPKKIPMRMCVGCREMKPKKELLRVVRSPEGDVSLDPVGKKPGRGVYICASAECMKKAVKQRQFERMLEVKIEQAVLDGLQEAVEKCAANAPDGGEMKT